MTTEDDDKLILDDVFSGRDSAGDPAPVAERTDDRVRDDQGRFAAKAEKPAEAAPDPAPVPSEPEPDTQPARHVPLKELLSEREKRQEEARMRVEAETRANIYEKQMQALLQQQRAPAPRQFEQPAPPDPFTDPEGYTQHHMQSLHHQMERRILDISETNARRAYGTQVVDEALTMAKQAGDPSYFSQFPDPWDALVQWGKRQKSLSKIGPDPEAYEKQVEERTRAQIMADLRAGKITLNGQPQTQQRFPGTLADRTPAGDQVSAMSDEAMLSGALQEASRRR